MTREYNVLKYQRTARFYNGYVFFLFGLLYDMM